MKNLENMKKIAVFGSREIDIDAAMEILNEEMIKENWYITSGNIKGVAECARMVAEEKGIKITLYNYESGLGFYIALKDIMVKNKRMVAECDEAIVIWNGESKGTEREIKMLDKAGKPYRIIKLDKSKFNIDYQDLNKLIKTAETTNQIELIEHLINHKHWRVRRAVSENSNAPIGIVKSLAHDLSPYVRYKANEILKKEKQNY